jgi:hypothetical protein
MLAQLEENAPEGVILLDDARTGIFELVHCRLVEATRLKYKKGRIEDQDSRADASRAGARIKGMPVNAPRAGAEGVPVRASRHN